MGPGFRHGFVCFSGFIAYRSRPMPRIQSIIQMWVELILGNCFYRWGLGMVNPVCGNMMDTLVGENPSAINRLNAIVKTRMDPTLGLRVGS